MDAILARSKEYESIVLRHDPAYKAVIHALDTTRKFIVDNGLIIYGGTGLDYALRLHGDSIYSDDVLPDFDFYSPLNVEHSYMLADILYENGYEEARAINAQHMETMRVDVVDNHFIADITYRPAEVFDRLPYLLFNGIKIIHPIFQRIDMHSSLSFPYDNPPTEVIFNRWGKDITRFNLLDKYYPITGGPAGESSIVIAPAVFAGHILHGFTAYAAIYNALADYMPTDSDIIFAQFSYRADMSFNTPTGRVEIAHFDIDTAANKLALENAQKYETYIHIIPERIEGTHAGTPVTIYSTKNKLLSVNSIEVGGRQLRVANVQAVLKYFIAMHFITATDPQAPSIYLHYYASMLKMIMTIDHPILRPSVSTYGGDNVSLAQEVALQYLYAERDGAPGPVTPKNYHPHRNIPKGLPHPPFDPATVKYFQELGRPIANV